MAVTLAAATVAAPALASVTNLETQINNYLEEVEEVSNDPTSNELVALEAVLNEVTNPLSEVALTTEEIKEPKWHGTNFTAEETAVLNYFQEYGITDRAALATLLGNVKQESRFITNICEGGARVSYHQCRRGGFGLIQWTTLGRYNGLGTHANRIGASPTDLNTQLSYVVTEVEWKKAEWRFKTPGKSIAWYMQGAYRWLGWGVHGNRTHYAQEYYNRLYQA